MRRRETRMQDVFHGEEVIGLEHQALEYRQFLEWTSIQYIDTWRRWREVITVDIVMVLGRDTFSTKTEP